MSELSDEVVARVDGMHRRLDADRDRRFRPYDVNECEKCEGKKAIREEVP